MKPRPPRQRGRDEHTRRRDLETELSTMELGARWRRIARAGWLGSGGRSQTLGRGCRKRKLMSYHGVKVVGEGLMDADS
jgi:hypothetical protein